MVFMIVVLAVLCAELGIVVAECFTPLVLDRLLMRAEVGLLITLVGLVIAFSVKPAYTERSLMYFLGFAR